MKRKKRLISILLIIIMCLSLCIPALAAPSETEVPSWVEPGEQWFPADGIMPLEDFGNCPKGHTGPKGYTYEGYVTGTASSTFDMVSGVLFIMSKLTGMDLSVDESMMSGNFYRGLKNGEKPEVTYFKYAYYKGNTYFYHIIYAEKKTNSSAYTYLTCETYYD